MAVSCLSALTVGANAEVTTPDGSEAAAPLVDPVVADRRVLAHPVLGWKMKIRKQPDIAGSALLEEKQQRHGSFFSSLSEASSSASSTFFSSSASWSSSGNGVELHSERKSSSREGWTSDGKSAREEEASAKSWVVGGDKQVHKGLARRWQRNEVRHGGNVGVTDFNSKEAVSRDNEGKLHTGGRFMRSEAVSDGVEVRREQVSKACIDGNCKESVQPQAAALVEGRPEDAIPKVDVRHGEAATADGLGLGAQPEMPVLTVDKMRQLDQELNGIVKTYLNKAQLQSDGAAAEAGPPGEGSTVVTEA